MSESLVLSSIFVGIIVLIGYIGSSFGVARGFVATAAIFCGSELALWWADDLGDRISNLVGSSTESTRFLGGMFLMVATLLLLGVSSSRIFRSGAPTRWGAFLGATLGAANGALLIALSLRLYYMTYSNKITSVPLDDSIVTRVLWRNFDWFLAGFTIVGSALLLYTRYLHLPMAIPEPTVRSGFTKPIPPPVAGPISGLRREHFELDTTNTHPSQNGAAAMISDEPIDETVYAPPRHAAVAENRSTSERESIGGTARGRATDAAPARPAVRYCPNCGMTLDPSDHFCPDCGLTL